MTLTRLNTGYSIKLEWVPVDQAIVNPQAQRDLDQKWASWLAANFDPDGVGLPFVWKYLAPQNGKRSEQLDWVYIIIDGQHRFAAIRMALGDGQKVQCEVVSGDDMTLERAAAIYRERNHIRLPNPVDDFRVGITAKDPKCLAIAGILKVHGTQISKASTSGIAAVSSVIKVYNLDGTGTILNRALSILIDAFGEGNHKALYGELIQAVGLMLKVYGSTVLDDGLINCMSEYAGNALRLRGAGKTMQEISKGTLVEGIIRVIHAGYNSKRRTNVLPEWRRTRVV